MIDFDEAVARVLSVARPLDTQTVPLAAATGRVLSRPVVAGLDSPRSDVSAMDGYAVRDGDIRSLPASLAIVGESFAGAPFAGRVEAGTCARIFTGAAVPAGAERVVIQENVRRDGDFAIIDTAPGTALHIRQQGSDFRAGDTLLPAGRRLDPRALVAAAAADLDHVDVYRQPLVQILSTGDELAEPGLARRQPATIPESVSFGVEALVGEWGGATIGRLRLRDDLRALRTAAAKAAERADLIVVTGGASVGEKDHAKAMFEPLGLELLFSKVAIKPGKPVWLGRVAHALVLGLPGNPTSAMVTARLLLAPLIAGLCGRAAGSALDWRPMPLDAALPACGARETFHRGFVLGQSARPADFQDSSAQKVLAEADLLIRQKAGSAALAAGELVDVLSF